MKTFIKLVWAWGALAFLTLGLAGPTAAQAYPGDRVSFQTFYDELDPYGRWINDPEYGYVWSPDVERGFQPYATRGHWVMTDYGNTWVSDYDWGWAPFHYGRWLFDDYYGWLWVPGTEWGPAWVDWRHSNGYYGWAPMGPRVTYVVPATRWVFVPVMYITSPRVYSYYVPRTQVVNIYHQTTIINNYYERDNRKYVYGPRHQDIERATNRKVNVYRVDNDNRPGRNVVADNSVRIYRPEVNTRRTEAPARVEPRTSSNSNRSRLTDSNGPVDRTDRGINSGRTRTTPESNTIRSRSGVEATVEQRSVGSVEGTRTRETVRRTAPASGSTSVPAQTKRSDVRAREEAPSRTGRTTEVAPAPRRERPAVARPVEGPAQVQPQAQPRTRQISQPTAAPDVRQQPASSGSNSPAPRRESTRGRN